MPPAATSRCSAAHSRRGRSLTPETPIKLSHRGTSLTADALVPPEHGHTLVDWIADYLDRIESLSGARARQARRDSAALPDRRAGGSGAVRRDHGRLRASARPRPHPLEPPRVLSPTSRSPAARQACSPSFWRRRSISRRCSGARRRPRPSSRTVTLGWLRRLIGLPDDFEGVIYDTASIATLHALVAAREAARRRTCARRDWPGGPTCRALRVYCSEQAHSSIDKAVIAIGLGQESLRRIPGDDRVPHARRRCCATRSREDRADGVLPMAVVATVGTTSTTSIDPVPDDRRHLRERERLWLHVDAAYGGVAAMLPVARPRARRAPSAPTRWSSTRTSGCSRRSI